MKIYKIACFIGSLRKDSYSRKIAANLSELAPDTLNVDIVEIGNLAMYNQDLESSPPPEWKGFRELLAEYDGVLFVTPEYNRSVPAVLKNAIDVGSRPFGKSAWNKKPGAVVSVSTGAIGAFGANHHLRQSLVFLNIPVMQQPEAYIGNVADLFDVDGRLINESTREFLHRFMVSFSDWVSRNC
jgi:chromate reductase, NAD(P)H dehydrogenase (quinone)